MWVSESDWPHDVPMSLTVEINSGFSAAKFSGCSDRLSSIIDAKTFSI